MLPGGLARAWLPNVWSFSSTCELPTFPLKSKPLTRPFLLSSGRQMSLNFPVCPQVPYSHGTPICAYIINWIIFLLLPYVTLMSSLDQPELRRVEVKLFSSPTLLALRGPLNDCLLHRPSTFHPPQPLAGEFLSFRNSAACI